MRNKFYGLGMALLVIALLFVPLSNVIQAQPGFTNFTSVAISQDVTIGDDATVGDDVTVGGTVRYDPATDLTLTMNGWITPTGSFQPVRSAGAVSISGANIADGTHGDFLILFNAGAQTITITETTGLVSAGNIALGALDAATLVFSGTTWIQIGASNN